MDLRGEDAGNRQLRDDLMTMLIAGHETTAAVLTWSLFLLVQDQKWLDKVVAEIDEHIGDSMPGVFLDSELVLARMFLLFARCRRQQSI